MQTSTTLSEHLARSGQAEGALLGLIGETPMLRLNRSGEGRVLLKHEGYNPGGSFFDRVARFAIASLDAPKGARLVVRHADAFALSLVVVGAQLGCKVHVLAPRGESERLHKLIALHGGLLETLDEESELSRKAELLKAGAAEVSRSDARALLAALGEVAAEVAASGVVPQLWVLPDYGLSPEALQAALSVDGGQAPYLELVVDDGEQKRVLSGPDAARRSQTGQREGVLLSPLGAELVEAAVNAAPELEGQVVAMLPEGGQRYLGWW